MAKRKRLPGAETLRRETHMTLKSVRYGKRAAFSGAQADELHTAGYIRREKNGPIRDYWSREWTLTKAGIREIDAATDRAVRESERKQVVAEKEQSRILNASIKQHARTRR